MSDLFDPTVGYADFDSKNTAALERTVNIVFDIMTPHLDDRPKRALVAGCGDGAEAALVRTTFGMKTVGVDVGLSKRELLEDLELIPGDLADLPFADGYFDFIYSYHVLEHVDDPDAVLAEFKRVLGPDGTVFLGFPNRNRIIAYAGTHTGETLFQKVKWNLNDYLDRIRGRFENELGAHAGFAQSDFVHRCSRLFGSIVPLRNSYMIRKYRRVEPLIQFLCKTGLGEFAFPSNYFVLKNPQQNQ